MGLSNREVLVKISDKGKPAIKFKLYLYTIIIAKVSVYYFFIILSSSTISSQIVLYT